MGDRPDIITGPSCPRCRPAGFTLVELLTVIGIIALLIAILLPSMAQARRQAINLKCLSNVRQIATVFYMYANENRGCLPVFAPDVSSPLTDYWCFTISPYFRRKTTEACGRDYLACPLQRGAEYTYGVNYTSVLQPPIFTYPKDAVGNDPRWKNSGKQGRVKSSTMLLIDSHVFYIFSPAWWQLDNATKDSNSSVKSIYGVDYNYAAFDRHKLTANVAFADGSARNVTLSQWKGNEDQIWGY